jgi:hypothetical protein
VLADHREEVAEQAALLGGQLAAQLVDRRADRRIRRRSDLGVAVAIGGRGTVRRLVLLLDGRLLRR